MFDLPSLNSNEKTLKKNTINNDLQKNWYVFYTAPRAEKIVNQELIYKGFEVFLPIVKTYRIWKNRQKKLIEKVIFPSYIFVRTTHLYLNVICNIPKISYYVNCAGIPCVVPFDSINSVKKMLRLDQEITVENKFIEGEKVQIIYGPLAGYEGILLKQHGKTKFGIEVKEINHTIFIDICTSIIKKV